MKLFQGFLALSFLRAVVAFPTSNSVTIHNDKEVAIRDLAVSQIERRSSCVEIAKEIFVTTSMEVATIYVGGSSYVVKKICAGVEYKKCEEWADELVGIMTLLFAVTTAKKHYGTAVANLNSKKIIYARESISMEDEDLTIAEALYLHGFKYDYIVNTTLPSGGNKGGQNGTALIYRLEMNNVRQGNGAGRDYTLLGFEDGSGQLQAPFSGVGNGTGSIKKRTTGHGIKIPFMLGSAKITNASNREGAAKAIAAKWLAYSKAGYTNMYGIVEKTATAVLYYRTIFELEAFGTNYENVNSCGSLSEFLGLYLGG
ncbi:hypothetical protein N7490_002079 [Penicillium lividum]|nr:hypothetical protein N7490_000015 [Penicillium lividum]KAJ5655076.1 hypothetical protein N7490_002079 [Penicillium lividum]